MYNEKLQLHIYKYENNNFSQIAIIDDYSEISFERNLYQAGQFTVTINHNLPNASKFEKGLFIQFGSDPYDFGEIRSISDTIGSDGKGSQNKIISGFDCRYLYKRRIVKNLNNNDTWQMTAKGEICLRSLIYSEAGEGAEIKRRLPITNTIPTSQNAIGKEYSVSEAFTNLYDVLVTIATQSEIGWRVKFENNALSLECYLGEDKHTTVQFSTDFETLSNGTFTDTNENFSNAVYVGGKGDGSERDIYEGESAINNSSPSGFERFECWDNQSEMNTEDEYSKEALSMLTQYGQTLTVNGNGLAKSIYVYKEQYNVGDIISVSFSGRKANVQILSVTEHWTGRGNYGITFSFGKPVNNLGDQIKLLLNKIQIASSKANTIDSVKWYEFSNANLSQDKKDVTFNSIGFTGTLSANRTFTLYLDDEGTGSKIYNIYAKNLSGNYNVTLTTGKSGATNAVIKGGVNLVARVYVDVSGNVILQSMSATDTIQSGNNQPATSNGVAAAIDALDVASVGGSGKYISAISETNGKISATAGNISDSVTDNDMNPVTSNAVADILSNLPTDAVLHYSFDEVPDYPDGTAVLRQLSFNSTSGWTGSNTILSIENSALKMQSTGAWQYILATRGEFSATNLKNKIVKIKVQSPYSIQSVYFQEQGSGYPTHALAKISRNGNEYIFIGKMPELTYVSYLVFNMWSTSSNNYILLNSIYIGDGSYSTPIIDNANGQNNATNNGGIAVQGVSGKSAYFLNGKYADMGNYNLTPNFTISMWVNPDNNEMASGILISKSGQFILRNGSNASWGMGILIYLYGANSTLLNGVIPRGLLPPKVWTLLTVIRNELELIIYINGAKIKTYTLADNTLAQNTNSMTICIDSNTRPQSIDDLLIFNRALSDTEVQALYLNKANTPKYFPVPTNEIKEGSLELVTSGAAYNSWFSNKIKTGTNVSADYLATPQETVCYYHYSSEASLPVTNHQFIIRCDRRATYGAIEAIDLSNGNIWSVNAEIRNNTVTLGTWQRILRTNDVVDSVTNNNMNPVTSNAVYNNFINKFRQVKNITSPQSITITATKTTPFYFCNLMTISRDNLGWLAIGIIVWVYNDQFAIHWIKSPSSNVGFTLTKISTTQSRIDITSSYTLCFSFIDLNGNGDFTIS